MDEGAPPEAFHSHLCAVVCELTSMERAVVFHYDPSLRRVRAVGAHGLDLSLFRDAYVTPDTAPVAREALERDAVVDVDGATLAPAVPGRFGPLLAGRHVACAPMTAGRRWVGVLLVDRPAGARLEGEERDLLWTLGKIAALAGIARGAIRQSERARELQQRLDLAREIHDGVVQRLFGVSLALSGDAPLEPAERERCAAEVQAALAELRAMVQRPLGRAARPTEASFAEELGRLAAAHADLRLAHEEGTGADVPPALEPLAQSVLAEAVRNARRHAAPRRVAVRTRRADGAFFLEVENDGVGPPDGRRPGVGLRLVAVEALQHGGVVEFGPRGEDRWLVRLVVPLDG